MSSNIDFDSNILPKNSTNYVFRQPRLIAYVILLIPFVLAILLTYAYTATKNETTASAAGPGLGTLILIIVVSFLVFGVVALSYILPKLTIDNDLLTQRNSFGHTSKPVNLTKLVSVQARRGFLVVYAGLAYRVWVVKLVDDNGNHITTSTGKWKNEPTLKQLIAGYSARKTIEINDAAVQLLNLE